MNANQKILKQFPPNTEVDAIITPADIHSFPSAQFNEVTEFYNLGYLAVRAFPADLISLENHNLAIIEGLEGLVSVNPVEHVVAASAFEEGNWGVKKLGVSEVWAETTGKGVMVGILDSGVDSSHPCLKDVVKDEHIVVDSTGNYNTINALPTDSGTHGTHVASIVAGQKIDQKEIGLAPEAKIYSIQVLEGNTGTIKQTLGGLDAVLSIPEIKIVNLSIELAGENGVFSKAIRRLIENQRIVVVAAGNSGPGRSASPGNYPRDLVISVGASTKNDKIWGYSNGHKVQWAKEPFLGQIVHTPTICAPGKEIVAAKAGGGLKMMSGTSMATPHVSACCALLLEKHPTYDHHEILAKFAETTVDLGEDGWDFRYGEGRINLQRALGS